MKLKAYRGTVQEEVWYYPTTMILPLSTLREQKRAALRLMLKGRIDDYLHKLLQIRPRLQANA